MVTRVRVEAEGRSTGEVEEMLQTAFEVLVNEASNQQQRIMFGDDHEGLADAQAGEFVIERFARDCRDETGSPDAGHGAVVYRGRMVSHFAAPSKLLKLNRRDAADTPGTPFSEA